MGRDRQQAKQRIVPAVAVAVVALAFVRHHTVEQSAWSGAGFGMFATYSGETDRWLVATAVTDQGLTERLALGSVDDVVSRRALVVPSRANLRAVVAELRATAGPLSSRRDWAVVVIEVRAPEIRLGSDPPIVGVQVLRSERFVP